MLDFDTQRRRAHVAQLRALLPGADRAELELLPFEQTIAALGREGEDDEGLQHVEVDAIVGSVNRVADFDRRFRPRTNHLGDRWTRLTEVDGDLPPVQLLRLNDMYFVEDGHHRVSIARVRGMRTIPAHVRRIRTTVCAQRCITVTDLPRKNAERLLLERVPLPDDVRVALRLDDPDDWRRVAEAAEAWGYRQSLDGRTLADRCELATAWWREEIEPVIAQLKERGICSDHHDVGRYLRELVEAS